jgi:hypothetical protein
MGDTISKFEEMEETKSYSGLGVDKLFTQTTTQDMTRNKDLSTFSEDKSEKKIFRDILELISGWNEDWVHYNNNSGVIERPLNADELAEHLSTKYSIEEF